MPRTDAYRTKIDGYQNLLTYSQKYDVAAWSKTNMTLTQDTPDTTAPDGTYTAARLAETAVDNYHLMARTSNEPAILEPLVTISAYIKQYGTRGYAHLYCYSTGAAPRILFDFAAGKATNQIGTVSYGSESVGNGWYRIWMVVDNRTFLNRAAILGASTNSASIQTYPGDTSSGLYVWGFQIVRGNQPGLYTRTDATAAEKQIRASAHGRVKTFKCITNPDSLSGLALWLAADKDVIYDGSNRISQWTDMSGNGRHATQSGADGIKPVWVANGGPNNKPYVTFVAASTQHMSLPSLTALTEGEFFIVYKFTTWPTANDGVFWLGAPSGQRSYYPYNVTSGIYDTFATSTRKDNIPIIPTPTLTNWNLYNPFSQTNLWSCRFNCINLFETFTNTVQFNSINYLGKSSDIAPMYFDGSIAEAILYSRTLTNIERIMIERYLAKKYAQPWGGY